MSCAERASIKPKVRLAGEWPLVWAGRAVCTLSGKRVREGRNGGHTVFDCVSALIADPCQACNGGGRVGVSTDLTVGAVVQVRDVTVAHDGVVCGDPARCAEDLPVPIVAELPARAVVRGYRDAIAGNAVLYHTYVFV